MPSSKNQLEILISLLSCFGSKKCKKVCFARELAYLRNPDDKHSSEVPPLVNNIDLVLDNNDVILPRGIVGKTLQYAYDVLNPILLANGHRLTLLIVEFYHRKCKHLEIQTTFNTIRTSGFWIPRMH